MCLAKNRWPKEVRQVVSLSQYIKKPDSVKKPDSIIAQKATEVKKNQRQFSTVCALFDFMLAASFRKKPPETRSITICILKILCNSLVKQVPEEKSCKTS